MGARSDRLRVTPYDFTVAIRRTKSLHFHQVYDSFLLSLFSNFFFNLFNAKTSLVTGRWMSKTLGRLSVPEQNHIGSLTVGLRFKSFQTLVVNRDTTWFYAVF